MARVISSNYELIAPLFERIYTLTAVTKEIFHVILQEFIST
jgi:hypothetical protein